MGYNDTHLKGITMPIDTLVIAIAALAVGGSALILAITALRLVMKKDAIRPQYKRTQTDLVSTRSE